MSEATPDYAVQSERFDRHEVVTLSAREADLRASFAPAAGMVGCSLRHAGEELLDLGGGLDEYARTGAPAGIPFLHPWPNRLAGFEYSFGGRTVELDPESPLLLLDDNGLPIHGLLGASPYWRVLEAGASDAGARVAAELDFGAHRALLDTFPFPHSVRIDAKLQGSALTIRTTVTPSGDAAVPVSFGFHPYLRLPGVPREQWEIALPVRHELELDERMIPTGRVHPVEFERGPLGARSFDDASRPFEETPAFAAAAGGRELNVTFLERYPFAQVYSPPGAQFICFEPMTTPTNALQRGVDLPVAQAPDRFSAAFQISVHQG